MASLTVALYDATLDQFGQKSATNGRHTATKSKRAYRLSFDGKCVWRGTTIEGLCTTVLSRGDRIISGWQPIVREGE